MNSRRSARQMGSDDSPITPRYSVMNASEPSRFWMPPESRVSPEYTAPAHAGGANAHLREPSMQGMHEHVAVELKAGWPMVHKRRTGTRAQGWDAAAPWGHLQR